MFQKNNESALTEMSDYVSLHIKVSIMVTITSHLIYAYITYELANSEHIDLKALGRLYVQEEDTA